MLNFQDWRADSQRQHEETIEAVRSTAQEQVPFNVQGVSGLIYCIRRRILIMIIVS